MATATRTLIAASALLLSLGGCNRPAESEPDTPAAPPTPETEAAAEATPEAVDDGTPTQAQLPVAEDFEQQVQTEIKPDNYQRELDALEKELLAEAP